MVLTCIAWPEAEPTRNGGERGPGAEAAFVSARNLLPRHQEPGAPALGAASRVNGIAAVRILARDGRALRGMLTPLLELWRGGPLPRPWTM